MVPEPVRLDNLRTKAPDLRTETPPPKTAHFQLEVEMRLFFAKMCCGNDAGSYLRLIDSYINQLEVPVTRVKKKAPERRQPPTARWTTCLSTKLNLSHAMTLRPAGYA